VACAGPSQTMPSAPCFSQTIPQSADRWRWLNVFDLPFTTSWQSRVAAPCSKVLAEPGPSLPNQVAMGGDRLFTDAGWPATDPACSPSGEPVTQAQPCQRPPCKRAELRLARWIRHPPGPIAACGACQWEEACCGLGVTAAPIPVIAALASSPSHNTPRVMPITLVNQWARSAGCRPLELAQRPGEVVALYRPPPALARPADGALRGCFARHVALGGGSRCC